MNGTSNDSTSFTRRVITTVAITSLALVLLLVFYAAFNVLLLVLAGTLIAVYFRGFALWISKKTSLSEKLSIWIVIAGTLLIITLTSWLLGARIAEQISALTEQLPKSTEALKEKLSGSELGNQILDRSESIKDNMPSGQDVAKRVGGFFKTTFGVVGDLYVVLLIGIFLMAQPSLYTEGILSLVPKQKEDRARSLLIRLGTTLRAWLLGKIVAMIFVAVLTAVGLLIGGVPMPLALALIAGLLNFIPNFGPLIALVPALLVGLSEGTGKALFVTILYVGVQLVESSAITPLIQKRLIQIPPAFIIIAQVTMGVLTGALGVILATPFVAILMVITRELYVKDALQKS